MKPHTYSSKLPYLAKISRVLSRRSGYYWHAPTLAACVAALSVAATPAFAGQAAAPSAAWPSPAAASVSGANSGLDLASPYGETSRFGGYDPTGKTPGKFVLPVGFAVDAKDPSTSDKNAVYVLDRTVSNIETGELDYRLQKLSSSGAVLGSMTLPMQHYTDTNLFTDAHPLISLAVDSSERRVYAIVESIVDGGFGNYVPVVQKLVAWSTVPNAGKELVPAAGFPVDPVTGAGLVAGESVLQPSEPTKDLYAPEAISVAGNHDAVIEAQQGVQPGPTPEGGPTILQRVASEGSKSGQLDGTWVANEAIAPENQQGDGLFTASNGSFGIDLYERLGRISRLADVSANFGKSEASPLAPDGSEGLNRDEAPSVDNKATINYRFGSLDGGTGATDLEAYTAGSPIAQLSNGLYAARFAQSSHGVDRQSEVEPWNGVPYFWTQANPADNGIANMGVRLFTSNGMVLTTIGGQPAGQACSLDTEELAVAAGANGSVFVLTQPNEANGNSDDQVIEFTPGGKGSCPQPSGSLTVNGLSGSSFSFPVGTNVTFADIVERKGETPYRFDWVLYGSSSLEDLKTQIEGPEYKWPAPNTSHTFTKAGTYHLTATVYGDYGLTYIATDTITIH
jgi:hypothetical protein